MLSIIIPAYNAERTLEPLLRSITESYRGDHELIVVDDASTDRTAAIVRSFPTARLVQHSANRGAAQARNTGVEHARSDRLIFFDADVVVRGDTIARLARGLEAEGVDIVQGIYSARSLTPGPVAAYKALREYHHWIELDTDEVTVLKPTFLAITKRAIVDSGGFDPRIAGASVEDYELGYRMLQRGYRIRVDRSIEVDHFFPATLRKLAANYFDRVSQWVGLFSRRRRFDNVGATPTAALVAVAAGLAIVSLPVALLHPALALLPLTFLVSGLVLQRRFVAFVVRERGLAFGLQVMAIDFLLWLVVLAAAVAASPRLLRRRRRAVT